MRAFEAEMYEQMSAKHETRTSLRPGNGSLQEQMCVLSSNNYAEQLVQVSCLLITGGGPIHHYTSLVQALCKCNKCNNWGRTKWNPTLELLLLNSGLCHLCNNPKFQVNNFLVKFKSAYFEDISTRNIHICTYYTWLQSPCNKPTTIIELKLE